MVQPKSSKKLILDLSRRAAFELVSVFVAILLALWVNDLYSDHQRNQKIQLAMASVKSELAKNYASLVKAHEHQQTSIEIMNGYMSKGEEFTEEQAKALYSQLFQRSMYRPADLLDTAWQVLIQSQLLNYMPYDLVLEYSHLYNKQIQLTKSQDAYSQYAMELAYSDISYVQYMHGFYSHMKELWWREKNLIKAFKNAKVN